MRLNSYKLDRCCNDVLIMIGVIFVSDGFFVSETFYLPGLSESVTVKYSVSWSMS